MRSRTTIGLAVLTLGLFAYIYFVEWRTADPETRAFERSKLFPGLEPAKVTNLEIVRSNQTIRVERLVDQWQLLSPPYPAQSTAIESFVNSLTNLVRFNEIPAQEIISQPGGLTPFGLDPPAASVKVQAGTNLIQFRVGARTLVGNQVYIQPAGAPGIFMTDAALLTHLPDSANQWRNPLLIPKPHLAFDRIAISAGARSFKLELDSTNQLWRLTDPVQKRADFDLVQALLQKLRNARVAEFVTDDPRANLDPFGLQSPEADVTLGVGSNAVFQIQIGKSPSNDTSRVYARCLSHTNVVLVSQEIAELLRKQYTDFRDRNLLSFRPRAVDRIQVVAEETFAIQRGTNDSWGITEPFKTPADPHLMTLFLDNLAKLEIIKFEKDAVADYAPYGLLKPQRQYVLETIITNAAGVTNETLLRAEFGLSPTNEIETEVDKVFCRRADENSVYVVRRGDLLQLPRAAYELRDRHVWSFASSNVVALTIEQGPDKQELVRDRATGEWFKNDQVRTAAIDETLHRLGALEAEDWTAIGAEAGKLFGTNPSKYQIWLDLVEKGKSRRLQLAFGKLATTGRHRYAAVVLEQGQPVIFKFPMVLYAWVAKHLSATVDSPLP